MLKARASGLLLVVHGAMGVSRSCGDEDKDGRPGALKRNFDLSSARSYPRYIPHERVYGSGSACFLSARRSPQKSYRTRALRAGLGKAAHFKESASLFS